MNLCASLQAVDRRWSIDVLSAVDSRWRSVLSVVDSKWRIMSSAIVKVDEVVYQQWIVDKVYCTIYD